MLRGMEVRHEGKLRGVEVMFPIRAAVALSYPSVDIGEEVLNVSLDSL